MSVYLATLRKDLTRLARDPWGVAVWLAVPVLLAGLMTAAFGSSGGNTQLRPEVLLVDEDESVASSMLRALFAQRWAAEAAQLEWTTRADAHARLSDGEATAMLVLPAGMQQAWLHGEPLEIPLLVNPSQQILPRMVIEAGGLATEIAEWLRRLLAEDLAAAMESGDGMAALPVGLRMAEVGERVRRWADPPRLSVRSVVPQSEPAVSLVDVMLPGWIWMALVFMAQGLSADVWTEKEQGSLARMLAPPRGARVWVVGKLLAGIVVATLVLSLVLLSASPDGASAGNLLAAGLFGVLSFAAFHAALILLAMCLRSARATSLVGSLIVFPLLMIGGSYFPLSALPEAVAQIGRLTPTGWSLSVFRDALNGSASGASLALASAGLVAVVIVCALAAARRLQRGFAVGA